MKRSRHKFTAKFKAGVAIEALKEQKSLAETVYLNMTQTGLSLFGGLRAFVDKYNNRRHQGINRNKPVDMYHLAA